MIEPWVITLASVIFTFMIYAIVASLQDIRYLKQDIRKLERELFEIQLKTIDRK